MSRSKSMLTRWFQAVWGEDPALRRIRSLRVSRMDRPQSDIPVFIPRKASMI